MKNNLFLLVLFTKFFYYPETAAQTTTKTYTKFQEGHIENASKLKEHLYTIINKEDENKFDHSRIISAVSRQIKENIDDMIESWAWVQTWWTSIRRWTKISVRVLNNQCLEDKENNNKDDHGSNNNNGNNNSNNNKKRNKNNTNNGNSTNMSIRARVILCTLLRAVIVLGQQNEPQPEFLAPLENHTIIQGRDVYFTCVVNHLSSYKVAWIKSDTKAILAIHTHMVAQNPRLSVTHNGHNTWKLHVSNVQKNDSGTYMCQINTDPMRSQMGTLEVVIPPDILNDNESTEGGGVAVEGGVVRLRCHGTGVPEPTVIWRREDSRNLVLRHEGGREKQVLRFYDGDTLVLANIQRADMGAYLCIASNGVPPSVSKRFIVRVHFNPIIRVSNQLVAAPVSSDVLVQCYVEASPRAMNHWMRDTGEKLIPSDKYAMEEITINDYSFLMNLTIKNLEKKDFGGYLCTSSNALGNAEGVIRLQELHLAVKSTSTTSTPRHVDVKLRKSPHKEKPKKYKRPQKGRKDVNVDDRDGDDDEQDFTTTTTPDFHTPPQTQTILPSVTHRPSWVLRSGVTKHLSVGNNLKLTLTILFIINRL